MPRRKVLSRPSQSKHRDRRKDEDAPLQPRVAEYLDSAVGLPMAAVAHPDDIVPVTTPRLQGSFGTRGTVVVGASQKAVSG